MLTEILIVHVRRGRYDCDAERDALPSPLFILINSKEPQLSLFARARFAGYTQTEEGGAGRCLTRAGTSAMTQDSLDFTG